MGRRRIRKRLREGARERHMRKCIWIRNSEAICHRTASHNQYPLCTPSHVVITAMATDSS